MLILKQSSEIEVTNWACWLCRLMGKKMTQKTRREKTQDSNQLSPIFSFCILFVVSSFSSDSLNSKMFLPSAFYCCDTTVLMWVPSLQVSTLRNMSSMILSVALAAPVWRVSFVFSYSMNARSWNRVCDAPITVTKLLQHCCFCYSIKVSLTKLLFCIRHHTSELITRQKPWFQTSNGSH